MSLRLYASVVLFLGIVSNAFSQYDVKNLNSYEFSRIVPASPTSSSLGKYGDWPVSYATGTPNISIPIYEIKVGKLTLPISISYHASGIKVEDVSSWVGAGWSLNAGGVISRTVFGAPDENTLSNPNLKGRFLPATFDLPNNDAQYDNFTKLVGDLGKGQYDSEPDIYFFNFAGIAAKCFMDEDGVFRFMPRKNFWIKTHPINTSPIETRYWEITDENGTTYVFGKGNAVETVTSTIYPPPTYLPTPYHGGGPTAWSLNSIISADKSDTIYFEYVNGYETYSKKAEQSFKVPHENYAAEPLSGFGYGYNANVRNGVKIGDNTMSFAKAQISRIYWRNGEVKFFDGANRADIIGKVLDRIEIYNREGQKIKSFQFSYLNNPERLYLNTLTEKGSDNSSLPPYQFSYIAGLPNRYSDAQDYWGYYNNANNTHMLPYENQLDRFYWVNELGGPPNANRNPNESVVMAGSLNRITYPTGGYTDFLYEGNRYYKTGNAATLAMQNEPGTYISSQAILESLDATLFPTPTNPKEKTIVVDKIKLLSFSIDFRNYRKGADERDSWLPGVKIERQLNDGTYQTVLQKDAFNNWDEATKVLDQALGVAQLHIDVTNFQLYPGSYRISTSLTCSKPGGNCGNPIPASSSYMSFSYEQYVPPSPTVENARLCGGIRIKSISNYNSGGGLAAKRSFEYQKTVNISGQNVIVSSGKMLAKPSFASVSIQPFTTGYDNGCGICQSVLSCSVTTHDLSINGMSQGPHIGYSDVKELFYDDAIGFKTYEFTDFDDEFNDPVFDMTSFQSYGRPVFLPTTSNEFKRGLLLKESTYKNSAGQFILIKQLVNNYNYGDSLTDPSFYNFKAMKVQRTADKLGLASCYSQFGYCGPFYSDNDKKLFRVTEFAYGFYYVKSAWVRIRSTTETDYDQNGLNPLTKTVEYSYANASHMQATTTDVRNSRGEITRTNSMFPLDYSGITGTDDKSLGIKNLQAKYVLNAPVEISNYRANPDGSSLRLVASQLNEYGPTYPLLTKVSALFTNKPLTDFSVSKIQSGSFTVDNRYASVLGFNKYDSYSMRLLERQKDSDIKESFLWGYNNDYLIANTVNASVDEIAYSSFEDGAKGNWTYAGTPTLATTPAAPTGRYYLTLNGGTSKMSRTVVSGRTYVLSYWRYNGAALSLSGATVLSTTTGATVNNWTFYEQKIQASSTTLQITGSGNVDEVRLYPAGAMMTTYTYTPLVGMSSESDPTGRITYYEYDEFGRLSLVRDQNRNLLKKYCYNYYGQPEDCGGFKSQVQTGNFTRNNCAAGGTGSTVSYTVVAGRFTSMVSQADANAQAVTALNSEGQAYANSNGTCTFTSDAQSGSFTRNNCGAAYVGSTVTYTIAAGAYNSTISKQDANNQAIAAVSSGGQAYANANGTCTMVTIYARAEYSGVYDDGDYTYGTVLLKFYSDAACTTPYSVSNLSVNYQRVRTNCGGGGAVTAYFSATCNGTSTSIGLQTLSQDDGLHCWNYAFSVTAGTGYTAK